jgi:bifunctional DNase/RNase
MSEITVSEMGQGGCAFGGARPFGECRSPTRDPCADCYHPCVFTRVHIATIALDPRDGTAVVVFEHRESGAVFPLWVADEEARTLADIVAGVTTGAHGSEGAHLLHGVIGALGGVVREGRITSVTNQVVRAEVRVCHGDEERIFSARATDAIALALRAGAPVVVDSALLDVVAARVREACDLVSPTTMAGAEIQAQSTAERWNQLIAHLSSTRPSRDASEV